MREMGLEDARRKLGEIVDRARLADQPTLITRQGNPAAVVIPVEWYERAHAGDLPGQPEDGLRDPGSEHTEKES